MDAVEEFFATVPNPEADHRHIAERGVIDTTHSLRTITKFLTARSRESDHEFILSIAKRFVLTPEAPRAEVEFRQMLGKLGLSQPQPLSITTWKGRQLQYYRWKAQGRKDEDCPSSPSAQGARPQAEPATHAYLPNGSPEACSNCDSSPEGLTLCSACHVKVDGCVITSASYCGKQCQKQHWPQHKSVCVARKRVWRAVQLVQALFVQFQTYTCNQVLEELVIRDGILYCPDHSQTECVVMGKSAQQVLTRDQAPSDEIFLAAPMVKKCAEIVSVCKQLVENLLKPLYSSIEEICVVSRDVYMSLCVIAGMGPHNRDIIAFGTHNLLRVTLPSGEEMAVDLSCGDRGTCGTHGTRAKPSTPAVTHAKAYG